MLNVILIASQFKVSEQKKDYINSINNTERWKMLDNIIKQFDEIFVQNSNLINTTNKKYKKYTEDNSYKLYDDYSDYMRDVRNIQKHRGFINV